MRHALLAVAGFAALTLNSCISVLPKAAPAAPRFLLEAVDARQNGPAVTWSLIVEDPTATRAYDTAKIAVTRAPGRLEYFGAGEWADRAPRLFQYALIRSYENTGRILGVGDRTALSAATYVLQTDIRNLDADFAGGRKATARVSVYARLTNGHGKVLAARLFDGEAQARSSGPDALSDAFDAAVGDVIGKMVDWSFDEGEKAKS